MSLTAERKHYRNELKAGVHLVAIQEIKPVKNPDKTPVIENGEMKVVVTFVTGTNPNQYHDQIYWVGKGQNGKERFFTSMCIDAGIDMSKAPLDLKAARNKRLWIAIQDVYTLINNGENFKVDITGEKVVEKFIFATAPIYDVEKPPTWKGDPAKNDGIPSELFVGYKEEGGEMYDNMEVIGSVTAQAAVVEVIQATPEVAKAAEPADKSEIRKKKRAAGLIGGAPKLEKAIGETPIEVEKLFGGDPTLGLPPDEQPISPMPNFGDDQPLSDEDLVTILLATDNMLHADRQEDFSSDESPDENF